MSASDHKNLDMLSPSNNKDYTPVNIPIHKELNWKLKRTIQLLNNEKLKDSKKTTYVSIVNDCIAIGIRELKYAKLLDKEYNKS